MRKCAVEGCEKSVPPQFAVCLGHYRPLPTPLRDGLNGRNPALGTRDQIVAEVVEHWRQQHKEFRG